MENVATNNPIDGDLFNNLHTDNEVQTTTTVMDPQVAVIRKCLHPPSSVPEYSGLPTNDARSQICIEWRNMQLLNTPYIYDYGTNLVRAVTAADLTSFEYAFLVTNGARVLSIPFIANSTFGGALTQDYNNVMTQDLYNFANWSQDANLYRPAYKSSTFYLNATAFNDTGMVVGNQFNPNILFAGTILSLAHTQPQMFYQFVKSGIRRKTINIIRKPTSEEIAKWETLPAYHRAELLRQHNLNPTDVFNIDPDTTIQVISLTDVNSVAPIPGDTPSPVPSTSQILGNSMRSLGCKAKEGMFSVQRLNTIAPAWLAASNTSFTAPYNGLYECYTYFLASDGSPHFVQLNENAVVGAASALPLRDTLWTKDMTFSWVRFSGLSLNSQTSVSTQLLIRKVFTGLEVQPSSASAWTGMIKLAPKPDLQAMQAMMDAFYELKDVMPARYNFWGTLGTIAAQGLATFGSSLLQKLLDSTTKGGTVRTKKEKSDKPRARPSQESSKQMQQITQQLDRLTTAIKPSRVRTSPQLPTPRRRRPNLSIRRQIHRPVVAPPAGNLPAFQPLPQRGRRPLPRGI
jgi:hypothetical protein